MFFFTAKDGTQLYMGKDKFENEVGSLASSLSYSGVG